LKEETDEKLNELKEKAGEKLDELKEKAQGLWEKVTGKQEKGEDLKNDEKKGPDK
jgi:hypothetical protein